MKSPNLAEISSHPNISKERDVLLIETYSGAGSIRSGLLPKICPYLHIIS